MVPATVWTELHILVLISRSHLLVIVVFSIASFHIVVLGINLVFRHEANLLLRHQAAKVQVELVWVFLDVQELHRLVGMPLALQKVDPISFGLLFMASSTTR